MSPVQTPEGLRRPLLTAAAQHAPLPSAQWSPRGTCCSEPSVSNPASHQFLGSLGVTNTPGSLVFFLPFRTFSSLMVGQGQRADCDPLSPATQVAA